MNTGRDGLAISGATSADFTSKSGLKREELQSLRGPSDRRLEFRSNKTSVFITADMATFYRGQKVWSQSAGNIQPQHKLKYADTTAVAGSIC